MWQFIPAVALLGILLLGAQTPQVEIQKLRDRKPVRQEILRHIPVGTKIEEAKTIMEENGFKCALRTALAFTEMDTKDVVAVHENLDYLYCDLELSVSEYCARRYQIAIVHENGIVSDVLVSLGAICA